MEPQSFYRNFKIKTVKTKQSAFTLIELMVVFVVIALIAGFAIPTYDRAIERSIERDAIIGLQTMRGALKMYRARNGNFPIADLLTYTDINDTLGINLVPNRVDYSYTYNSGVPAIEADSGVWIVGLADMTSTDPIACTSGTCPTCVAVGSGGCKYGE